MKAGYARVSTKEQTVDLQVDALKKAGCTTVYTEIMSGTRAERPILGKLLENLRTGDVLVVWKLDRLGRSLKHLIEVVNELMTRKPITHHRRGTKADQSDLNQGYTFAQKLRFVFTSRTIRGKQDLRSKRSSPG